MSKDIFQLIEDNETEQIKELLASGADFNITDPRYRNPVWVASFLCRTDILKLLLEHNTNDVDAKDTYGETPLFLASYYGRTEVVKLLLEHGANVNDCAHEESLLFWPSCRGFFDIVELMVKFGAYVNPVDNKSVEYRTSILKTICISSPYDNQIEIIKLLIANGAKFNV